jgi:phosphatidylglycerophosphate synthase
MHTAEFPIRPRRAGAAAALTGGFVVQATLLGWLLAHGIIGLPAMTMALAIYSLMAALVWRGQGAGAFGLANTVTTMRCGMIAVLPALIVTPQPVDPMSAWSIIGFGLVALALDGVDGRLARTRNEASEFGARFDMEVDAAYVLFLSGLAATTGRAGAWILLAGLMRYLWVAATAAWPVLRRPLPPSLLRKSVCVIVLLLLLSALAPLIPSAWAALPCALALALLLVSFGRDLVWLMRRAGMAAAAPSHIHRSAAVYDGCPQVESE